MTATRRERVRDGELVLEVLEFGLDVEEHLFDSFGDGILTSVASDLFSDGGTNEI